MKFLYLVFTLAFLCHAGFAQTDSRIKVYSDKSQSSITYFMIHPLHSWSGVSKDFTSVILANADKTEIYQVALSAKISTFDSHNANRDSHMMEVTEAIKYPSVTFQSTSIKANGNKLNVTGNLSLHGVTQSVSFGAEQKLVNNKLEVTGSFNVNMKQYKIDPPSLMGMAVDENFKVEFKAVY